MLIVKSKYKIAKRRGAGVFDQTQTQKFSLSEARSRTKKMRRSGSDYGRQLLEKQRVRFTYGLSEKHLSNYVEKAMHAQNPSAALHSLLEMRIDNAMYRAGFASTRRAARQMVSHGHIVINGQRTTVPSHRLKKGDVLTVREGSKQSSLFGHLAEGEDKLRATPRWISVDPTLIKVEILQEPIYGPAETTIDYKTVFEFYSR